MSQPEADVKNSDTLGRYRKNFKFLKEVKILSEFLHSKLACLMPIYVSGRRTPEVPPKGLSNTPQGPNRLRRGVDKVESNMLE